MTITVEEVLAWVKVQKELSAAKVTEGVLRKSICYSILGEGQTGAQHHIFAGIDLTATGKENITIDPEVLTTIWPDLTEEERACIVPKPTLAKAKYKKLPADSLLNKALTSKEGMPGLKVKFLTEG